MPDYIIRSNETVIFSSFERSHVCVLLGSRRVGKSTLVDHYIKQRPARKWAVLNMDRLGERSRVEKQELERMIEEAALAPIGGEKKNMGRD